MASSRMVSVIVPTFNYGRYLPTAIESALRQTYKNREIIVVDDGSTDDTQDVLATFGQSIRMITQRNQGVSVARNTGVAASSGEIVAFLDADDAWHERKLELQVALLDAAPDLGLIHCAVEHIAPNGTPVNVSHTMARGMAAVDMLLFRAGVGGGSTPLIPRSVFVEVGGFDPELSTSADFDLYLRIAARAPIDFVPEPLVLYTQHQGSMKRNIRLMETDMTRAFVKAFANLDVSRAVQREAWARLHLVLAGSYLHSREPLNACTHAIWSLTMSPRVARHILSWPKRARSRKETAAR